MLYIITPCSREHNLPYMYESLRTNLANIPWKWYVVGDGFLPKFEGDNVVPLKGEGFLAVTHSSAPDVRSCHFGKPLINYALDRITEDGFVCVLDDDNVLHPKFAEIYRKAIEKSIPAFLIDQQRGSGVLSLRFNSLVDQACFAVKRSFIGATRYWYNQDAYTACHADQKFFHALYDSKEANWWEVCEVACYYNQIPARQQYWNELITRCGTDHGFNREPTTDPSKYRILQDVDELTTLSMLVEQKFPNQLLRCLEMGVGYGGLMRFMAEHWQNSEVWAIDNCFYDWFEADRERNLANSQRPINFKRGDIRQEGDWLGSREHDFVFIDADHSYEGVRQDTLDIFPSVRSGGWIAFHDTVFPDQSYGVARWVAELKAGAIEGLKVVHEFGKVFGIAVAEKT